MRQPPPPNDSLVAVDAYSDLFSSWQHQTTSLGDADSAVSWVETQVCDIRAVRTQWRVPLIERFETPPDTWTFVLTSSPADSSFVVNGQPVPRLGLTVFRPGEAYDCLCPPGGRSFDLHVPEEVAIASGLTSSRLAHVGTIPAPADLVEGIGFGRGWPDVVATLDALGYHAECEHPDNVRPSALRRNVVVAAQRLIDADPAAVATIAELARSLNTTRRTLERGFREHYGVSPLRYLTQRRLHQLRTSLLNDRTGDTVLQHMINVGLHHPGRSALAYRSLFGEPPSVTRTRSISRTGPDPSLQ